MNAQLKDSRNGEKTLALRGTELRRDLRITSVAVGDRFRLALYAKGRLPTCCRPFLALASGSDLHISGPMYSGDNHSVRLGGAQFEVTAKEAVQIDAWLAALAVEVK